MKISKRHILSPLLILFFGYILFSIHEEVRQRTIDDFNSQQLTLAKQAAKGIENFFTRTYLNLRYLASIDDVVLSNKQGKKLLNNFYHINSDKIKAVTLVSAKGRIVYTAPFNSKAIGTDISYQNHVQAVIHTQKPIVSDVFSAVQGYKAVAFHVPILVDDDYLGSLAVLIPFDSLTDEYLKQIKIGKSGHAWLISQQGTELFCPLPGHVGKKVSETLSDHYEISGMVEKMRQGKSGNDHYSSIR